MHWQQKTRFTFTYADADEQLAHAYKHNFARRRHDGRSLPSPSSSPSTAQCGPTKRACAQTDKFTHTSTRRSAARRKVARRESQRQPASKKAGSQAGRLLQRQSAAATTWWFCRRWLAGAQQVFVGLSRVFILILLVHVSRTNSIIISNWKKKKKKTATVS